ncbi:uncharacterized protein JCM15063_003843 [Sporobolomyces koalae]|uniref:uncharacterized protein n=1 Tax=Sporobolomyces koalae TaxID=500713 RepID=UPI00317CED3D
MPHKRQKRSIRLANQDAKGYNNPPSAKDSLLPIASTSYHGEPIDLGTIPGAGTGGTGVEKRSNKRRKPSANGTLASTKEGAVDLNGMSKSAYRILNAAKLREEYHAEKKRKLAEEEAAKHPNQKKKKTPTLQPLPYESLSTFNRRVEQEMRSTINQTIQASKNVAKKTKEVLKQKDNSKKKSTTVVADDLDEEWNGIDDGPQEEDPEKPKYGKATGSKPTPEESRDPFAKQPKRTKSITEDSSVPETEKKLARGRTGKTEFDTTSQIKRVNDVNLAPPTLAKPARKGLLAKALHSASDGTTGSRFALGEGGQLRLAGMEEPVGRHRLPVDPVMKALLDRERERAVQTYRELKEKKLADAAAS